MSKNRHGLQRDLTTHLWPNQDYWSKKIKGPTIQNQNKYTVFSTIYNSLVRKAKSQYFHEQFQLVRNNIIQSWTLLRTVLDKQIFFANIGNEVCDSVTSTDVNLSTYLNVLNQQSVFLDPVTTLDIVDNTNKIRSKTNIDKHNISTKLLKWIGRISCAEVVYSIKSIFWQSISTLL